MSALCRKEMCMHASFACTVHIHPGNRESSFRMLAVMIVRANSETVSRSDLPCSGG